MVGGDGGVSGLVEIPVTRRLSEMMSTVTFHASDGRQGMAAIALELYLI